MLSVLIPTAALIVFAQAAPQLNNLNLQLAKDLESWDIYLRDQTPTRNENHHQNRGINQLVLSTQSTFARRRHANDHSREIDQNQQESSGQCWDPVHHVYRDGPSSQPPPSQYPHQYYNDNYQTESNYNPSMYLHHYREGHWGGPQAPPGPPPPHRHGTPPYHHGPPHHHGPPPHHHGPPGHHGPPPNHHGPPPHHHGPPDHHGPPPNHHGPPDHHGPPPHHHGQGPPPLPPRPPHRPYNANSYYELELCQDTSKENVLSEKLESSTSSDFVDVVISSSTPAVSSTSVKPKDVEQVEAITQSPVKVTTEFDWNNYFVDGATADNTGGAGVIDIRSGGLTAP